MISASTDTSRAPRGGNRARMFLLSQSTGACHNKWAVNFEMSEARLHPA
jgi:hypothetical protein